MRTQYRTAPATPYTLTAAIISDLSGVQDGTQSSSEAAGIGIGFRDSSGKCVSLLFILNTGPSWQVQTDKWTSAASYSAGYKNSSSAMVVSYYRQPTYLRISDNGTNLIFSLSIDRIHWTQFDSRSRTDFFASGPTQIFWGGYANLQGVYAALVDWTLS